MIARSDQSRAKGAAIVTVRWEQRRARRMRISTVGSDRSRSKGVLIVVARTEQSRVQGIAIVVATRIEVGSRGKRQRQQHGEQCSFKRTATVILRCD